MEKCNYLLLGFVFFILCTIQGQQNLVLKPDNSLPIHKFIFNTELKSDFINKKTDKYYFYYLRRFSSRYKDVGGIVYDYNFNNPYGKIDTLTKSSEILLINIGKKECIEINLKDSLRKGQLYHVSCYVQLAQCSPYKLKGIPILFSKNSKASSLYPNEGVYFSEFVQDSNRIDSVNYLFAKDSLIVNEKKWQKVSSEYIGKGGEKFLIIGMPFNVKMKTVKNTTQTLSYLDNFRNKEYFKKKVIHYSSKSACYFIDSISVTPKKNDDIIYQSIFNIHLVALVGGNKNIKNCPLFELKRYQNYPLNKVFFKDSVVDVKKSYEGLNTFYNNIYNRCPNCRVVIVIISQDTSNFPLYNKRINSLREYFINTMKIPSDQILFKIEEGEINRIQSDENELYFRIDSF